MLIYKGYIKLLLIMQHYLLFDKKRVKKSPDLAGDRGFESEDQNKSLAATYLRMASATLLSALSCFTTEFGMVSGGTSSLLPPRSLIEHKIQALHFLLHITAVKSHGQLVQVSFKPHSSSTPCLSTSSSSTDL